MCGFDPHSSPEIFFSRKEILRFVYMWCKKDIYFCSCYLRGNPPNIIPATFSGYNMVGYLCAELDFVQ